MKFSSVLLQGKRKSDECHIRFFFLSYVKKKMCKHEDEVFFVKRLTGFWVEVGFRPPYTVNDDFESRQVGIFSLYYIYCIY